MGVGLAHLGTTSTRNVPQHRERPHIIKPMFAAVKKLWEECDDDDVKRSASSLVTSLGAHAADLMDDDDVDVLIDQYLSGEQPLLISE